MEVKNWLVMGYNRFLFFLRATALLFRGESGEGRGVTGAGRFSCNVFLLTSYLSFLTSGLAAVNNPPVANPDSYAVNEDTTLFIGAPGVLGNDTDAEGSSLTAILVSAPAHGTLSFTNNGSFSYRPVTNFNGSDSFSYKARDGQSNSVPTTVIITVNAINDAPRATNDSYSVNSDTALFVNPPGVLGNDLDVEGNALTSLLVSSPAHGTLNLNSNGGFTYSPAANYSGSDSFTYRASDGITSSAIATVTFTVVPAPIVVTMPPANQTACAGDTVEFSVSATGTALAYQWFKVTNSTSSILAGQTNSTLTLSNVSLADAATYKVKLSGATNSLTNSATLTVNIPVTPVALGNLVRYVGSIAIFSTVTNGTGPFSFSWLKDGAVIPAQTKSSLVLSNLTTSDMANYSAVVQSPCGSVTNSGSLTVASCFNAVDVMLVIDRSGSMSGQPYTDARTACTNFIRNLHLTAATNDAAGLVSFNPTSTLNQTLTNKASALEQAVNALGPATNGTCISCGLQSAQSELVSARHRAEALPVMVLLSDGVPHDFDTPSNALYTAQQAKNAGTRIFTVGLGAVDTTLMESMASSPGDYFYTTNSSQLAALFDAISTILCRPPTNIFGPEDVTVCAGADVNFSVSASGCASFSYQWRKDGVTLASQTNSSILLTNVAAPSAGVFSVVVTSPCRVVTNSARLTVNEPAAIAVPLSDQASYIGSNALFSIGATGTSLSFQWFFNGSVVSTSNTLALNNLTTNDAGVYSVVVSSGVCGEPVTNCASLTLLNRAPLANDDVFTTPEDTTLTIVAPGVLSNDTDPDGNSVNAVLVNGPTHGVLSLHGDGSFNYVPVANFHGVDSFTYRASDGDLLSGVATVTLTVTPVNDPPVAQPDSYTMSEDTVLNISAPGVLGNDSDVDGDALSAALVSGPSHGAVALNTDGSFIYRPVTNYNGADRFTYAASDGSLTSAPVVVSITILPINDPPVANPDSYTVDEDTTLVVTAPGVLANDTDIDGDSLTFIVATLPTHGALTLNLDGSFTYLPATNFHGTDSFTYRANDGQTNSGIATVTITVTPVNDTPVAVNDDFYITLEDTKLDVPAASGVLTNDFDVDEDGLTAILASTTTNGVLTLNTNGAFVYLPATNFNGVDHFTYRVTDGTATSEVATVTIIVLPVNDAPVANDDSYATDEDSVLIISAPGVLGNDSDVDGDALSAALVSGTAHGTLVLNLDGSFSYLPVTNFHGMDSFTYRASDGTTNSNLATVTLLVRSQNDPPVTHDDAGEGYSVLEDHALIVTAPGVLANDTDVDGDNLTAVLLNAPSHGTLTLNSDGSFLYTPVADYFGGDSFTYVANDGITNSSPATVSITVIPVNDAPSFVSGPNQRVNFNASAQTVPNWATSISAGPVNESTQALHFVVSNDRPTLFSVQPAVSSNGTLTYTPAGNGFGVATVTVVLKDDGGTDNGGVDTAGARTFVLTLNGPPVVSIVSPTNGSVFVGTNNITVVAEASDPDSVVTNVQIFLGTNVIGNFTNSPYFVALTNLAFGMHSFQAVAADDLGLLATSSVVSVVITQSPPVTALGPIVLNHQNGLFEQFARIFNPTPRSFLGGVRLFITGLDTTNRVYNATGTNAGVPYIDVPQPLFSGGFVDVLIQYYVPNQRSVPNPTLLAEPLPFTSPQTVAPVLTLAKLMNMNVVLEFIAASNRLYYVQFSEDFSRWNTQPGLMQGAGAPVQCTNSSDASHRFFRVLLLP